MCVTYILLLSYTITLVSANQECGWNYCDEFSYCDSQYKECLPCSGICYDGTKYDMLCKTQCPDYQIAHETTSSTDQVQVSRERIESSTLEYDSITIPAEQSNERKVNISIGILVPIMFIMIIALLYLCKGQKHASNIIKSWRGKPRTTSETDPEAPEPGQPHAKQPLMEPKSSENTLCPHGGTKPGDLPKPKDEIDEKLDTTRPPVTNISPSDLTSSR